MRVRYTNYRKQSDVKKDREDYFDHRGFLDVVLGIPAEGLKPYEEPQDKFVEKFLYAYGKVPTENIGKLQQQIMDLVELAQAAPSKCSFFLIVNYVYS